MRASGRRFDFYLDDMLEAMQRILEYTNGMTYRSFVENKLVRDAVIRNFEIMGESVKHLSYSFQKKNPKIPWQNMFYLRNFIVHEYFDVDDEILWQIIVHDLPENLLELTRVRNEVKLHNSATKSHTINK